MATDRLLRLPLVAITTAAILMVLLLVAVGVLPVNLFFARGLLSQLALENLGVELHIDGPLRLRFGKLTKLDALNIGIALPGASDQPIAQLRKLEISADPFELLRGDIHLGEVRAAGLDFDYCQTWADGPDPDTSSGLPSLAVVQLHITELRLWCNDPEQKLDILSRPFTLTLSAAQDAPLELTAQGGIGKTGDDFKLAAVGGTLTSLLSDTADFPLKATLDAPGVDLIVDGSLQWPLSAPGLDVVVEASVNEPADLAQAFGQDIPALGALDFQSTVQVNVDELRLLQTRLSLADISLAGDLHLDLQADCPRLTSNWRSGQLDLDVFHRFTDDDMTVGGRVGDLTVETLSCGDSVDAHLASLHLVGRINDAELAYEGVDLPLRIESALIDVARNLPGKLSFDGVAGGEPLTAAASFGSMSELLSAASWPLALQIQAVEGSLKLTADVRIQQGQVNLDGGVEIALERFGALHSWTGAARFGFGASGLQVTDLDARLGNSHITGGFTRLIVDEEPLLAIELEADLIDLDELGALFPPPQTQPDVGQGAGQGAGDDSPDDEKELTDIEWVEQWFAFPDIDFDIQVARIAGLEFEAEQLATKGHIRDKLIDSAQLSLRYEGMDLGGDLSADLRNQPWTLAYRMGAANIDVGRVLARLDLAGDVTAGARQLDLEIATQGLSIRQLLANADFSCRLESFNWAQPIHPASDNSNELSLSYLEVKGAPATPTLWSGAGMYNAVDVKLLLRSPSLGGILDKEQDLPLQLVLASGRDVAIVDTVIERRGGGRPRLRLDLSGAQMDPGGFSLADLQAPLGAYEFKGLLSSTPGRLRLSDMMLAVGSSRINGQVDVLQQEGGYRFDIGLHSPLIETEDFVALLASNRTASGRHARPDEPDSVQEQEGFLVILNQDLARLTEYDSFDINLLIDELYSTGNLLGRAEIGLLADRDGFQFRPFELYGPGGKIEADFTEKRVANGVEAQLELDVERLEYGGLLRLLDAESQGTGTIFLSSSLTGSAPAWKQIASGINGTLDIAVFPQDLEAGFLDLWASNLIFALLPAPDHSGKQMNCMVARFEANQGVMESTNTFIDSTDVIVRARGTIDMGKQQLDLVIAPQAKSEKFFSINAPLQVTGPFDDFSVKAAPGSLVATLARWYYGVIYVPWKWLTGERFPADGIATCYNALEWELPQDY